MFVSGVFSAVTENIIESQNPEGFEKVFESIVIPVQALDDISRKKCPQLDHFVVMSSLASNRGINKQENYGMAFGCIDRLCEKRKQDSLPALAVQFGPVENALDETNFNVLVSIDNFINLLVTKNDELNTVKVILSRSDISFYFSITQKRTKTFIF